MNRGLSVREVERLVREKGRAKRKGGHRGPATSSSAVSSVEEKLRQFLGTKVQLRPLRDGKGEILIEYYSADDLDRLLEIFAQVEDRSR